MSHKHRITMLLENAASVECTDGLGVITLTSMESTNLYIKLTYTKILPKNTHNILVSVGT